MRILTGIKPTGNLTLGNYIGVLKNMKRLSEDQETFIFIADLHSLTVPIDPEVLRTNIRRIAAFYLASGLDPKKVVLFKQSDVSEHAELYAILQNYAYLGELSRMHQYKDLTRSQKGTAIGLGILTYPVLMAADILLYDVSEVPVGDDQKQHVELAKILATRFNNHFGDTFKIPHAKRSKIGMRIMSLSDPMRKMSKSDPKGDIFLLDSEKEMTKKIMAAVTDSGNEIIYDKVNKPGISNLLTIYAALQGQSIKEVEKHFVGLRYGDFKKQVAEIVVKELLPLQKRYQAFMESDTLDDILEAGAKRAKEVARKTLERVKVAVGLK
ncbi:MAG: tryptophan--tRNA ligase [Erysipelotrichaceae bacterium]|jgi:tryptophanyl-tRNA synthetase|nr:tryptophan--tRNA ligase [Erysipelotrichaceae bacterium]